MSMGWGDAIDELMSSSMDLISIGGEKHDETGQMHPRINALRLIFMDDKPPTNGLQHSQAYR